MSSASMFGTVKRQADEGSDPVDVHVRVGVLALQGAFIEHINILNSFPGVQAFEVRSADDCEDIDGLVLPGGESSTMGRLIKIDTALRDVLDKLVAEGLPMWGTCAGMILLSKEALGGKFPDPHLLRAMDITVMRNFFGPQTMSFESLITVTDNMKFEHTKPMGPFPATFIRAPIASQIRSEDVKVLASIVHEGNEVVVAVEQGPFLGTSFHPELTDDNRWHEWWLKERVIPRKEHTRSC
ncbi:glutamine aminotransferase subunit [Schizosaccharomyces japonicus yFS275]|uniref:glutaminase n=1 Tax=Schizosaccharomyces japonicus (strain yFS275 / FY16936) TaxID=402676 RepID=B6JWB7_SCHJY|nr:glutamine aminotransferase subunit [Schizosaccharomyces japonicus yFS275]EEB05668.1 glutamine aminotransferase subunit [Schizosaccharomyces japonicus yFS275]